MKVYIGPPSERARYTILASCIRELMRVQIVSESESIADFNMLELAGCVSHVGEGQTVFYLFVDVRQSCKPAPDALFARPI